MRCIKMLDKMKTPNDAILYGEQKNHEIYVKVYSWAIPKESEVFKFIFTSLRLRIMVNGKLLWNLPGKEEKNKLNVFFNEFTGISYRFTFITVVVLMRNFIGKKSSLAVCSIKNRIDKWIRFICWIATISTKTNEIH